MGGLPSQRVCESKADGEFEAHLVALSCGDPPKGFARWSLRMLADRAVELEYIDSVPYETVRRMHVFMASEPLADRRMTKVTERKTKRDWAHFVRDIAQGQPIGVPMA